MAWRARTQEEKKHAIFANWATSDFNSSACSFTSVWLIVFVSHENFVRIARAHQVKTICTRRRALASIGVLCFIAAVIYNCHLWTSRVLLDSKGQDPMCMALSRYRRLLVSVSVLDLIATLVLPVLAVLTIMTVTLVTVVRAVQRQRRLNQGLAREQSKRRREIEKSQVSCGSVYESVPKAPTRRIWTGPHRTVEMKVARFLTIVTLTLIILSSPSHALRLKMVINSYLSGSSSKSENESDQSEENDTEMPSMIDATLQRAFEVVYYLSFSGNLFIFLAAGRNFRRIFVQQMRAQALCCCFFLRFICCDGEVKSEVVAQKVSTDDVCKDQSPVCRAEKLSRKQSFSQRYMNWLRVDDTRKKRDADGSDREISRGASTSIELCSGEIQGLFELENFELNCADIKQKEEEQGGTSIKDVKEVSTTESTINN
ncbi:reverse transcriptase [Plakobranchus ocellatus]|uniref:Reverse transcriptase n=1 Tax=Plakobranchus ocellatus TaxID=259542 RepID=A0AAV3XVN3_9GAST|nr:reverse transcriptase [Plakobranchus ocellatus]